MCPRRIVIAMAGVNREGGIETYCAGVASGLKARGWDVHCLATNYRGDGFEDLRASVTVHDMSDVPLTLRKPVAAARLVNGLRPAVVLLNHCPLMHYAMPLLHTSIKPVAVLHSDDPRFYAIAARQARRVFRWIAPTPALKGHFARYLSTNEQRRVRVIAHGINLERFRSRADKRPDQPQIAFVGFVGANKGADLLPDIFARVAFRHPNAQFIVIGDGPLRRPLAQQIAGSGLAGRVRFAGPLKQEAVAEQLRASHALILPTRIEGFGLVIAEAMMSGAVPVVSRLPGITDQIVEDRINGRLVTVDDVKEFAEAIGWVIEDPARHQALSRRATERASAKFDLRHMLQAYEGLFDEEEGRSFSSATNLVSWTLETLTTIACEKVAAVGRSVSRRAKLQTCSGGVPVAPLR